MSKEVAEEALKKVPKFADTLGDTVKGAAEGAEAMTNLQAGVKGLVSSTDEVVGLGTAFKGLGIQLKSLLLNPATIGIGAMATVFGAAYYEATKFDRAIEKAAKSQASYTETADELKTLQSELKTTSDRIEELESQGNLTITEESELEKLKLQNAELKRQYVLKEKIANEKQKESAEDAKNALKVKGTEDLTNMVDMSLSGTAIYGKTDIITASTNELKELEKLKEKKIRLSNEYSKSETSNDRKNQINEQIKAIDKTVALYEKSLTENLDNLSSIQESLKGTKEYDVISDLINDFANIDLSPAERSLNNLNSFFSSSSGKNAIKKELEDAYKSGENLETVLSRMGLTLNDLGIDNIDRLNSYLAETTATAENATKSVQDYSSTVEDVASASETSDQDAGWLTIQGHYKKAKELLAEGKTGTDDFQSMASFLNPARVKELAEQGGKYISDAYQQAFEEAKLYADRWFGEDQATSMKNFVNDFKGKGLFDVSTDGKGLWDISTNFTTSAQAAKDFGVSVQMVETMLHGLESYGYDFGNVIFSTDGLARYEAAFNGLKQIQKEIGSERLDKMFSGDANGNFEGWDAEYAKIKDDLNTLTEPQIIKIEFEYSLAQIQQEIDRLQILANEGGDTQTWAELNANKREYRDKAESLEGNNLSTDVEEYKRVSETIIALQDQMKNATDDAQKQSIQNQISNLYDLQNELNDMFAETNLSWDEFIQTKEFNDKINELVSSSEEAKDVIAKLFGIKPENIQVDVDADTSKAEKKFYEILKEDKSTHIMLDANPEEIINVLDSVKNYAATGTTIVFNGDVDGVKTEIAAVKNEDGTISYIANMNGVEYYLQEVENEDGTISYTLGDYPKEVPDAKQIINREPHNPKGLFSNLKPIFQPIIRFFSGGGDSNLAGTAHLSGTAFAGGTFDNSFVRDKWKTSKGEVALTGEENFEIVANGNKWWTVGDKGAEFSYIPPNSVVFNAEQSKQLLEKGYINSRGTAHLSGTSYRLGSNTSSTSASKKSSSKSSNSSSNSAEDKFEEVIDWIAVLLERVAKQTERAIETIDTAIGLVNKQSATSTAISKVQNEIAKQQQAYNTYLSKANSLGLSSDYVSKVQNGSLNIENITNEDLKKKIEDYKKW